MFVKHFIRDTDNYRTISICITDSLEGHREFKYLNSIAYFQELTN